MCYAFIIDGRGVSEMLDETTVPEGIVKELRLHFKNVIFELGSSITENTITRKLHYREIGERVETRTVLDPITFEEKEVTGIPTRVFMARLDEDGDTCIVRRVGCAGEVVTPC